MNATLLNKNLCYFCNKPASESPHTVNGKPEDHKVCPECFKLNQPAIQGARARIAAFDKMFGF